MEVLGIGDWGLGRYWIMEAGRLRRIAAPQRVTRCPKRRMRQRGDDGIGAAGFCQRHPKNSSEAGWNGIGTRGTLQIQRQLTAGPTSSKTWIRRANGGWRGKVSERPRRFVYLALACGFAAPEGQVSRAMGRWDMVDGGWKEKRKQDATYISNERCGRRTKTGPGGDAHTELLSRQAYGGECKYVLTPPRLASWERRSRVYGVAKQTIVMKRPMLCRYGAKGL
ncbi:hypothetical protein V8C42DRAFT_116842 [Trichoderma barbatum]